MTVSGGGSGRCVTGSTVCITFADTKTTACIRCADRFCSRLDASTSGWSSGRLVTVNVGNADVAGVESEMASDFGG